MKRIIAILLSVIMVLSLSACGGGNNEVPTASSPELAVYSGSDAADIAAAAQSDAVASCDKLFLLFSGGVQAYVSELNKVAPENVYAKKVSEIWDTINFEEQSYLAQDILEIFISSRMDVYLQEMEIKKIWIAGYGDDKVDDGSRLIYMDVKATAPNAEPTDSMLELIVEKGEKYCAMLSTPSDQLHSTNLLGLDLSTDEGTLKYNESNATEIYYKTLEKYKSFDGVHYEVLDIEEYQSYLMENISFIEIMNLYRQEVYMPKYVASWTEEQQYLKEKAAEKAAKDAEPKIGMTKDEVINGLWGEPDKKNIDEYEWGTHEQWVYDSRGYIYFENDIVTSISHRE